MHLVPFKGDKLGGDVSSQDYGSYKVEADRFLAIHKFENSLLKRFKYIAKIRSSVILKVYAGVCRIVCTCFESVCSFKSVCRFRIRLRSVCTF